MPSEITESYLLRVCRCNYQQLHKWLSRSEFYHIQRCKRPDKRRKDERKKVVYYLNMTKKDLQQLKNFVNIGFRNKRGNDGAMGFTK